jgi:hypothetical protein
MVGPVPQWSAPPASGSAVFGRCEADLSVLGPSAGELCWRVDRLSRRAGSSTKR